MEYFHELILFKNDISSFNSSYSYYLSNKYPTINNMQMKMNQIPYNVLLTKKEYLVHFLVGKNKSNTFFAEITLHYLCSRMRAIS